MEERIFKSMEDIDRAVAARSSLRITELQGREAFSKYSVDTDVVFNRQYDKMIFLYCKTPPTSCILSC